MFFVITSYINLFTQICYNTKQKSLALLQTIKMLLSPMASLVQLCIYAYIKFSTTFSCAQRDFVYALPIKASLKSILTQTEMQYE